MTMQILLNITYPESECSMGKLEEYAVLYDIMRMPVVKLKGHVCSVVV